MKWVPFYTHALHFEKTNDEVAYLDAVALGLDTRVRRDPSQLRHIQWEMRLKKETRGFSREKEVGVPPKGPIEVVSDLSNGPIEVVSELSEGSAERAEERSRKVRGVAATKPLFKSRPTLPLAAVSPLPQPKEKRTLTGRLWEEPAGSFLSVP